ncbi:anaerobic sulfite reductase subunit B [archaeon BMS3Abin17]|nr:anaerobic sulfite reductase subunit B [archaeon BMS3Abin17]
MTSIYQPKNYKIKDIKLINPSVRLFRIISNLNPMPGQFIEASIPGIGEAPLASCSYDNNYLDILVKKTGNLTGFMFQLKPKDNLWIRGAYGHGFPVSELQGKNIILISGGTGIAPVASLVSYIEKNRKKFENINIYFGFRDEDSILIKDKIKEWKKKFNLTICVGKKNKNSDCAQGFVQDIIGKDKLSVKDSVAVLCGPEIMMFLTTRILNKLGLTDDKIYWSLERRMECALGSCGRCLLQDVYVCRDGPIFRYDKIKPKLEAEKASNKIKV